MNFLTLSLTLLGLSASNNAIKNPNNLINIEYPEDASKPENRNNGQLIRKDTDDMWEVQGRWRGRPDAEYDEDRPRREHWDDRRGRGNHEDRRRDDEGRRRRGEDRTNDDDERGRERGGNDRNDSNDRFDRRRGRIGNGNDNNITPYPPNTPNPPPIIPPQPPSTPSYPPIERDNQGPIVSPPTAPVMTTFFPPLPIIIEPIRSVVIPSIIESYPEVVSSETYYGSERGNLVSTTGSHYTSYIPSSIVYAPTPSTYSSASYAVVTKKQVAPMYSINSTIYASTVIMTEAESTVTTKVTGRYRAMSNSANNLAGSITFSIILLSSILLIALV